MANYEKLAALQRLMDIEDISREVKVHALKEGLGEINDGWNADQVRVFRANFAYHIDDGLTEDSLMNPHRVFGEVIVKGTVPELRCIESDERLMIAFPFCKPIVLGPEQSIEPGLVDLEMDLSHADTVLPLGVPLRRPLYIPFCDITFTMLAA